MLDLQLYAGLTITNGIGKVHAIEYITDLAQTNNWQRLAVVLVHTTPYVWADMSAPARGRRFYRAVDLGVPTNIVLDELGWELERRGLRFVRYADDANIFVASRRAGKRVMASLQRFLEKRLRPFINAEKSAVRRPQEVHFLGFRFAGTQLGSGRFISRVKRWRGSKPGCRR